MLMPPQELIVVNYWGFDFDLCFIRSFEVTKVTERCCINQKIRNQWSRMLMFCQTFLSDVYSKVCQEKSSRKLSMMNRLAGSPKTSYVKFANYSCEVCDLLVCSLRFTRVMFSTYS